MLNDAFRLTLIVLIPVAMSTNTNMEEADGREWMDYTIHQTSQWKQNISTMFQWTLTILDLWGKMVAIATTVFMLWVSSQHALRVIPSYRDEHQHQQ